MLTKTDQSHLLLFVLVSLYFRTGFSIGIGYFCQTAEISNGVCVLIKDCPHALSLHHFDITSYIANNMCDDYDQKICCPNNSAVPLEHSTELDGLHHPSLADVLPNECGFSESYSIVGGENVELGEFPWMVYIDYEYENGKPFGRTACGGALISKRHILTAAHCILETGGLKITDVRLGEFDLNKDLDCMEDRVQGSQCSSVLRVGVVANITHESYGKPDRYQNDIALLYLSRDVEFNRFIRPICLPQSAAKQDIIYYVAGWGRINTYNDATSTTLQKLAVEYFPFHQCKDQYAPHAVLSNDQMCFGAKAGEDSCKGDSGGPLMSETQHPNGASRWSVDGITSFGRSHCGKVGWPGVYTKVFNYVPWIIEHLSLNH